MNNANLNYKISEMFLTDARDYLKRYNILKEKSTHIGLRGKLLVELLFAVECALKSLIYIESEFDEKKTYDKIHTHKLIKLIDMLSTQSKNEYNKLVTTEINHFIVGIRYQLESEIDFRNEYGVLDKKYYDTIANFDWLDNLSIQISKFMEYIEVRNPFEIKTISILEINIEEEIEKHTRLVKLKK
jgi:hypothetical protein